MSGAGCDGKCGRLMSGSDEAVNYMKGILLAKVNEHGGMRGLILRL